MITKCQPTTPAQAIGVEEVRRQASAALRQSEDLARRAQRIETVGRLAGGVAHEFNNLLMGISGYAQLLIARAGSAPEATRELKRILDLVERGAGLVRGLQTFAGRQDGEMARLRVGTVVGNCAEMLRVMLRRSVQLELQLPADEWEVLGDTGHLEMAVANLVQNARDAMPEGGTVVIAVSNCTHDGQAPQCCAGTKPGDYASLSVTDTGPGMDEAVQRRLFDPFFTTKGAGGGTGLGLPVVHGIVTQHGGHIGVESSPGRGSTFRICIPRASAGNYAQSLP